MIALAIAVSALPMEPPPGWTVAPAGPWRWDPDGVALVPPQREPFEEVRLVLPLDTPYPGGMQRFMVALDERLGGPRASPAFRNDLSAFDVYWRLVARGLVVVAPPTDAQRALDVLLIAGGFAADDLVRETLARNDGLDAAGAVLRTFLVPSLTISPGGRTPLRVGPADPRTRNPSLARAAIDEAAPSTISRVPRPPPAKIDLGTTFEVRDIDAPETEPLVDVAAYVNGEAVIVQRWRFAGLASGAWEFSARQPVLGTAVDLGVTVRSRDDALDVGRLTVSATRALAWRGDDALQVRLSSTRVWATEKREQEDLWLVELRARTRWRVPFDVDRPPLGSRWNHTDPSTPWRRVEPTTVVLDVSRRPDAENPSLADADR